MQISKATVIATTEKAHKLRAVAEGQASGSIPADLDNAISDLCGYLLDAPPDETAPPADEQPPAQP